MSDEIPIREVEEMIRTYLDRQSIMSSAFSHHVKRIERNGLETILKEFGNGSNIGCIQHFVTDKRRESSEVKRRLCYDCQPMHSKMFKKKLTFTSLISCIDMTYMMKDSNNYCFRCNKPLFIVTNSASDQEINFLH